jgi:NDP-sugar pyrophosphorylase family protein
VKCYIRAKENEIQWEKQMEKKITLVIMAAGLGSRFGGLKQWEAVGHHGETLMDYSIYDALKAGFNKIVFIIQPFMEEQWKKQVVSKWEKWVDIDFSFQDHKASLPEGLNIDIKSRTRPWGTTQALLVCKKHLSGPFAILNADDFYGKEAFQVMAQHLQKDGHKGAMLGYTLKETLSPHGGVTRGICYENPQQKFQLKEICEMKNIKQMGNNIYSVHKNTRTLLDKDMWVSMNFWGFDTNVFSLIEESFESFLRAKGTDPASECLIPEVINDYVKRSLYPITILPVRANWFGMTYKEDKEETRCKISHFIKQGLYPSQLVL